MSELFRRQAVEHATSRLTGAVVLATPLSVQLLGDLLVAILAAATTFAAAATYARKLTVGGWIVPDKGLIRATASAQGHVVALLVKKGQVVVKGTCIAQIGASVNRPRVILQRPGGSLGNSKKTDDL